MLGKEKDEVPSKPEKSNIQDNSCSLESMCCSIHSNIWGTSTGFMGGLCPEAIGDS